ncbi:MAG: hypothetical protein AAGA35_01815 [Patescibacteria group bacterium]
MTSLLKQFSIATFSLLLLAAVVTSSCGVDVLAEEPSVPAVAEAEVGEDEFCNCHLKAEIDNLGLVAGDVQTRVLQVAVLPRVAEVVIKEAGSIDRQTFVPPDIHAPPPDLDWPVKLARSHLS